MFDKNFFSERLRKVRIQNKTSQQNLADYLQISKQAVSMMERGQRAPSVEILVALADYFNVSLDYLVGRSDNPERR